MGIFPCLPLRLGGVERPSVGVMLARLAPMAGGDAPGSPDRVGGALYFPAATGSRGLQAAADDLSATSQSEGSRMQGDLSRGAAAERAGVDESIVHGHNGSGDSHQPSILGGRLARDPAGAGDQDGVPG